MCSCHRDRCIQAQASISMTSPIEAVTAWPPSCHGLRRVFVHSFAWRRDTRCNDTPHNDTQYDSTNNETANALRHSV
jgi:hypothetical protein